MNAARPRRGWFRFSLLTLFVVVTVCSAGGYWLACRANLERAQRDYEHREQALMRLIGTPAEACESSLRLFHAEARTPFADRRKAAGSHLERVENIREIAYGPFSEWLMGVSDEASLAEAQARKAEIDRYYDEARRIASGAR
jgi:hypothetical protein